MAKTSSVEKNKRREKLSKLHAPKRAALKAVIMDRELPAGFLTLTAGVSMSDSAKAPVALYEQADQALAYATDTGIALRIYSAEVADRAGRGYRGSTAA